MPGIDAWLKGKRPMSEPKPPDPCCIRCWRPFDGLRPECPTCAFCPDCCEGHGEAGVSSAVEIGCEKPASPVYGDLIVVAASPSPGEWHVEGKLDAHGNLRIVCRGPQESLPTVQVIGKQSRLTVVRSPEPFLADEQALDLAGAGSGRSAKGARPERELPLTPEERARLVRFCEKTFPRLPAGREPFFAPRLLASRENVSLILDKQMRAQEAQHRLARAHVTLEHALTMGHTTHAQRSLREAAEDARKAAHEMDMLWQVMEEWPDADPT
jgi:hypothetical protein